MTAAATLTRVSRPYRRGRDRTFGGEFNGLRALYADYKRQAALLDFDDLLHHARDLLDRTPVCARPSRAAIRASLSTSFRIPIPSRPKSCGCSAATETRANRGLHTGWRAGSLFLVGDPKQAIYRFRGADVDTYLEAKRALLAQDPGSIIEITANFRSRAPDPRFCQ